MYALESGVPAYCKECWWSDSWNPLDFGQAYDFNRSFFDQYGELLRRVPLLTLSNGNSVNTEYANFTDGNKNCYLVFGTGFSENVSYARAWKSRDSQDCYVINESELCYECVNCVDCYRVLFSRDCRACQNSYFLLNCRNCSDCFGSANLVGKSYCFFNQQCSKEEYQQKLAQLDLSQADKLALARDRVEKEIFSIAIRKYANIVGSVECTGDNIHNSKNAKQCFDIMGEVENSKYINWSASLKESYDGFGQWQHDYGYENVDSNIGQGNLATITTYASHDCRYAHNCHGCEHCFGCIGLRQKQYCILNKQYSKEEYEALIPKIIEQMSTLPYAGAAGRVYGYGDFLPAEISPFAYNETIAQEYFPLTKEIAKSKGYKWKELAEKNYVVTLPENKLPNSIAEVSDAILGEVISCAHQGTCDEQCSTAFRLTLSELQFYRKMNLPVPHLCSNCRHYARLRQRNPIRVWHRSCMCSKDNHAHTGKCPNEFETSYAPERPEIVYCEQCYQTEVA